jgi:hypothetical protein
MQGCPIEFKDLEQNRLLELKAINPEVGLLTIGGFG